MLKIIINNIWIWPIFSMKIFLLPQNNKCYLRKDVSKCQKIFKNISKKFLIFTLSKGRTETMN